MGILLFLLILSFLVIIHELGHFLSARYFKMIVEEFGIGYPPRAFRLFVDKLGTEYTFNWLPFGGFVRLFGEDGTASVEGQERDSKYEGAFFTKPHWQRLVVILAGAAVNFIFGVIAFGAIYTKIGIPVEYGYVRVDQVSAGSPAETAGIMPGTTVSAVVVGDEVVPVTSVDEFIEVVGQHKGETVALKLVDDEESISVYVRSAEETPAGDGSMGVVVSDMDFVHYPLWQMPFRGMWVGLQDAVSFGGLILQSLGSMVSDMVTRGQVPQDVAGPVGIVYAVEREGLLDEGFWAVLNFAAILSINLAIVNVLPFPALDGGRAVMIGVEMVTRRKVDPLIEQRINAVGFMLLIGMIVAISVKDVGTVLRDEAVQQWWQNLR